jgi:hypothetical protein
MEKLKVFICAFDDKQFSHIPDRDFLEKVNISKLNIGEYQSNQFCEHRIYFSDLPEQADAEYVGFLTWRWEKYENLLPQTRLLELDLSSNKVYCARMAHGWYDVTINHHIGMQKYLEEMSQYTGLPLGGVGFWANNFICHKSVYLDFQKLFRDACGHFHRKYGFDYDYYICEEHLPRKSGAFYERISLMYFANRKDLELRNIPINTTWES